MNKKIEFITTVQSADYAEGPISASQNIPKWYKDIPVTTDATMTFGNNGRVNNLNVKNCMPFFDAISMGYHIVLTSDVNITFEDGHFDYRFPVMDVMGHRDKKPNVEVSDDFMPIEFIWKMLWTPKTPKGYSCLITHPMNRYDLPFQTLSGVIDSDIFYHSANGSLPFYIKKGFSGVIKKGTPIAQVIPFKRDNWKKSVVEYDTHNVNKRNYEALSVFKDFYKKFAYVKKIFK